MTLTQNIKDLAVNLKFDEIGFAPAYAFTAYKDTHSICCISPECFVGKCT